MNRIITILRKPLTDTVARNVLAYGTGGLNVDASRIEGKPRTTHSDGNWTGAKSRLGEDTNSYGGGFKKAQVKEPEGRWPANVILIGRVAKELDEDVGPSRSAGKYPSSSTVRDGVTSFEGKQGQLYEDSGGPSRYFKVIPEYDW